MTRTRRSVLLFGGAICCLFGPSTVFVLANTLLGFIPISWSDAFMSKHGDAMDWRSRWLAGSHSINCGRVRIGQNPNQATKCGLEANAEGRPFRVRYDIQGWDSEVAGGLIRTGDGHLYALCFDGNPSGGGRTSLWGQTVAVAPCPEPTRLYVNPKGRLNCFQAALSYPRGITSANTEPY
jgi:hypothetical protein